MNNSKLCSFCKYEYIVKAQDNYQFYGCYHPPYRGKACFELDVCDCPLTKEEIKEIKDKEEEKYNRHYLF